MAESTDAGFRSVPGRLLAVALSCILAPLVSAGVFIVAINLGWQPAPRARWLVLAVVGWPVAETAGLIMADRVKELSEWGTGLRRGSTAATVTAGSLLAVFIVADLAVLFLWMLAGSTE
jgi:hypothetical protein